MINNTWRRFSLRLFIDVLIDSVLKKDDKYYPRVFLKECRYIIKEKKKHRHIKEELKISLDESDKESDKKIWQKNRLKLNIAIMSFLR